MIVGNGFSLLDVDLSSRRIIARECAPSVIQKYLGGQGLAMSLLHEEVGPSVDPLAPENVVVVAPGLLTGTEAPASSRTELVTKSPLTGNLGRGNFGGLWGAALRQAGYLALVVRGEALDPVYLRIEGSAATLVDCPQLWGCDTWVTTDRLRQELGSGVSILTIGPAGENCVRFACPVVDYHHAPARSHAGCVMGKKHLKAIVVRRQEGLVPAADPKEYRKAIAEARMRVQSHPNWSPHDPTPIHNMLAVRSSATAGQLGCRNYQTTSLPKECEIWHVPESVQRYLRAGPDFCEGCDIGRGIGCNTVALVGTEGSTQIEIAPANYLLTIWMPQAGFSSYEGSWKAREICQRLGLDQITPIPLAMEWFQEGIISLQDTDGVELTWGNESAVHEMLRRIANREGFGDVLAEGSQRAAQAIGAGADRALVLLKGMPILGRDPRVGSLTKSLGALVGSRGGDDLSNTHALAEGYPRWARDLGWGQEEYLDWLVEWLDMPRDLLGSIYGDPPTADALDPANERGKASLVCWHAKLVSVIDSLGLCMFPVNNLGAWGPNLLSKLVSAFLGQEIEPEELMRIGHRVQTLMRVFACEQGFGRKDDTWPSRFYDEPLPDGAHEGATADRELTEQLVDDFHREMGWDMATGDPTAVTLDALGLKTASARSHDRQHR